jgi:hypothetical protein
MLAAVHNEVYVINLVSVLMEAVIKILKLKIKGLRVTSIVHLEMVGVLVKDYDYIERF